MCIAPSQREGELINFVVGRRSLFDPSFGVQPPTAMLTPKNINLTNSYRQMNLILQRLLRFVTILLLMARK
ncbi:hypothetical protein NIES39_B00790 [Arthrospira platensis NIES-39]|nr:hypothetical protein NIES39_B00790 [Arthrospira platensis NIES-39]